MSGIPGTGNPDPDCWICWQDGEPEALGGP
jgi:hypothetical protein